MTAAVQQVRRADSEPPGWHESLAAGAAGIALARIEHARAGSGGWKTAQRWITTMTRHPITSAPGTSCLFRGAPAVAFVLHTAAKPEHSTALEALDNHVAAITRHRLERASARLDDGQLPALREFDLIGGLTGLGVYHLARDPSDCLVRDVLAYLVRLTEPVTVDDEILPGW